MSKRVYYFWIIYFAFWAVYHCYVGDDIKLIFDTVMVMSSLICIEIKDSRK